MFPFSSPRLYFFLGWMMVLMGSFSSAIQWEGEGFPLWKCPNGKVVPILNLHTHCTSAVPNDVFLRETAYKVASLPLYAVPYALALMGPLLAVTKMVVGEGAVVVEEWWGRVQAAVISQASS